MDMCVSKLQEIIGRSPQNATSLIAVLQDIQREFNYLPKEAIIETATALNVPLSKVYGAATFYNAFSLVPQGRHKFQVCTGTACHVRGAMQVLDRLETQIGIQAGQTRADLEYTLETVNCLGACALGPIVMTDGEYAGQMTASQVDRLLKKLKAV